jgi:hypothetical protein
LATAIVGAAILFGNGASARTFEVWLADLDVTLTAVEDQAAGQITHDITVMNIGDDTGRDIVITHIPVIGVKVVSFKSQTSTCMLKLINTTVNSVVQCTLPQLAAHGGTEQITVVTSNTTTWPGRKITTAQAWGLCQISTAAITRRVWNSPDTHSRPVFQETWRRSSAMRKYG